MGASNETYDYWNSVAAFSDTYDYWNLDADWFVAGYADFDGRTAAQFRPTRLAMIRALGRVYPGDGVSDLEELMVRESQWHRRPSSGVAKVKEYALLALIFIIAAWVAIPAAHAQVGIDSPLGGIYLGGRGPDPYYSHPDFDGNRAVSEEYNHSQGDSRRRPAAHAQLAIGPGGVQLGEPLVRHHGHRGHHMSHERDNWAHDGREFRPQSPPVIHHYDDEDEE